MFTQRNIFGLLLLFFLLLNSQRNVIEVEAKICAKPSKFYKGLCGFDKGCAETCQKENWPDGKCVNKGFFNTACECRRPC